MPNTVTKDIWNPTSKSISGCGRRRQSAAKVKSAISADEMPIKLLYVAIAGSAVVLCVIAILSTQEMGLGRGIFSLQQEFDPVM